MHVKSGLGGPPRGSKTVGFEFQVDVKPIAVVYSPLFSSFGVSLDDASLEEAAVPATATAQGPQESAQIRRRDEVASCQFDVGPCGPKVGLVLLCNFIKFRPKTSLTLLPSGYLRLQFKNSIMNDMYQQ